MTPLVNGRLLGSDGLRGVGAQISWTLPVPWYSQFLLGVQNGRGNTGLFLSQPGRRRNFYGRLTTDREARGIQDFVWIPRWENSVDLSPTQTVLAGVSGAFGSNDTGANTRTQIYGADLLYKWKSAARRRRVSLCEVADAKRCIAASKPGAASTNHSRSRRRFMTGACIRRWSGVSKRDGSQACAAIICTCRIRNFTDDRRSPEPLAHFGGPDLVSDRVFQNPAAIQSRFLRGERISSRHARPIPSSSSSNSSSARTAHTNSKHPMKNNPHSPVA